MYTLQCKEENKTEVSTYVHTTFVYKDENNILRGVYNTAIRITECYTT